MTPVNMSGWVPPRPATPYPHPQPKPQPNAPIPIPPRPMPTPIPDSPPRKPTRFPQAEAAE
ncbi:uncharacterized protein EHS24_008842 [Apiotrichum porosum]|uniref:Uncharacterized protein n=1 Tax=Apiotrichum porosum TaxID=105984 RepID=A0A427XMW9_9TREE|nr:uncharacterized protein EHS24_008842 [Apiotrichum porosum]RSH80269.1 hypothetical protein EHS24_008842 [Apiotrichum porosum]